MLNETVKSNPLFCDPAEGFCELPEAENSVKSVTLQTGEVVKIIYFTDPICSSCWAIEPQLRKLKLEYGKHINIEYRMGGLLPDWSYSSGGINQASDVARHWDEASLHYDMPIDGDVWLEDPLHSSYPPSIAYKAAQMQDTRKADLYLRGLREMLFLEKKNITKWEHLESAAIKAGLNTEQLKSDMQGDAKTLFEEDLKLAKSLGVRGFPTMFFIDSSGNKDLVYGSRPYSFYETAILKLNPKVQKDEYSKDYDALFSKFQSLTAKEYSELSGTPRAESEKRLNELSDQGIVKKLSTKNGAIWRK